MNIVDSTPVSREVLFEAAANGDLDRLEEIVEYTGTNLDMCDDKGRNALFYGVLSDNIEILKYLSSVVPSLP